MPRFSIVVPSYNASDTLEETLGAVLAQTWADWECVVVDDGSLDATASIAQGHASRDARIRVLSQANQGSGGAYNTGVRAAVGDYVVMCSADDILLPAHLEEVARFITAEPGYDIYSTNGYFWRPDGSKEVFYPIDTDSVKSLTLEDVLRACFYSVGATYRRGLFEEVGGYRVEIFGEDYDFWLRAMAQGATHRYLPLPLSLHRVSPTQKSADLIRVWESDIGAYEFLVENGLLTAEQCPLADAAIELRRGFIRETLARRSLESQTSRVEAAVHRMLGKRAGGPVLALARGISKVFWPLRVWLARRLAG